jgi:hypothetical protein
MDLTSKLFLQRLTVMAYSDSGSQLNGTGITAPFVSGALPTVLNQSDPDDITHNGGLVLYDSTDSSLQDGLYIRLQTYSNGVWNLTWVFTMPMTKVVDAIINNRELFVYYNMPSPVALDFSYYQGFYPSYSDPGYVSFPWPALNKTPRVAEHTNTPNIPTDMGPNFVVATSGTVHGWQTSSDSTKPLTVIKNAGATSGITFELPNSGSFIKQTLKVKGILNNNITVVVNPNDAQYSNIKIDGSVTSQTIGNSVLGFDYAEYYADASGQWWRVG